jgi:hypothetical protein
VMGRGSLDRSSFERQTVLASASNHCRNLGDVPCFCKLTLET